MMTEGLASAQPARIGPNAIVCTLEAVRERIGPPAADHLLRCAELDAYRDGRPTAMVPEIDVSLLYCALRAQLGEADAEAVARDAGYKTARYILAHRIPAPAQVALRLLPPRLSAPLLLWAIGRHTWTFAGSASVAFATGPPVRIELTGCVICRGVVGHAACCVYYAAAFEGLFRALVSARAAATEIACAAQGAKGCVFEIRG
jgi:divinyl protochlorophyllide a 8-vinyl-reductase